MDIHRRLGLAVAFAPLVEAAGGDEAAAALERAAKRWLLGDPVGARVDHLVANRLFFRPRRDQPPAIERERLRLLVRDHGNVLRRRDVVARREIDPRSHICLLYTSPS